MNSQQKRRTKNYRKFRAHKRRQQAKFQQANVNNKMTSYQKNRQEFPLPHRKNLGEYFHEIVAESDQKMLKKKNVSASEIRNLRMKIYIATEYLDRNSKLFRTIRKYETCTNYIINEMAVTDEKIKRDQRLKSGEDTFYTFGQRKNFLNEILQKIKENRKLYELAGESADSIQFFQRQKFQDTTSQEELFREKTTQHKEVKNNSKKTKPKAKKNKALLAKFQQSIQNKIDQSLSNCTQMMFNYFAPHDNNTLRTSNLRLYINGIVDEHFTEKQCQKCLKNANLDKKSFLRPAEFELFFNQYLEHQIHNH